MKLDYIKNTNIYDKKKNKHIGIVLLAGNNDDDLNIIKDIKNNGVQIINDDSDNSVKIIIKKLL